MKKKISDYIWETVASWGVRHVFMFPGGGAMHLVDSLGACSQLQYVTLMHEQACVMAAETYARIDYNMGAALVTTGPGGTNAVTGVTAAWLESTPLVVFSGQVKTSDLKGTSGVRQKGNQEIGITDIVKSVTKYAVTITEAEDIKYHLERACYMAKEGRPGPVWLDIPLDIQAAVVEVEDLKGFTPPSGGVEEAALAERQAVQVLRLLSESKRPIVIAGQGIERGSGASVLRDLVETLQIPVLTSWIGTELLEFSHPLNMGKPGMVAPRYSNFAMQASDLVIAIGTRLDPSMIGYDPEDFAPGAEKILVDVDKAELDKFQFPVTMKVQMDATGFLKLLTDRMKADAITVNREDWLLQCNRWKQEYPVVLPEFRTETASVHPYVFIEKLSEILNEEDVIIPGSSGAAIDVFWLCIQNRRGQRLLATGSLGSMGYGLPASIGACLASGRRTVCVEGDGSLQLNIQELASIKGMNLPIKIFVMNNGGYLSILNMQRTHFSSRFVGADRTSHLHIPDITAVASAYGFSTFEIRGKDSAEEIIAQVMATDGPALCNVFMSNELAIQPRVMSRVNENGSMVSGKLKDLWPFLDLKEN